MSRSRRLLVVSPDFPPAVGGIQHLLGEVLRRLSDWDVTVLTRALPHGATEVSYGDHLTVRRMRATLRSVALAELNLRAGTGGRRYDVVLCGHVICGPGAVAAARIAGAPVVTYVYADEVPHREKLAGVSLSRSARVIAISRYTAELAVSAGARPEAIRLVPPGAGPMEAAPKVVPVGRSIVTIARLTNRYKGHDLVLEALPRVRDAVPDVIWHVVGDGPLRGELEARAQALGVADVVRFHGRVDNAKRDALLADAAVFTMPSRLPPSGVGGEGFGIVFLEAALLGIPSVAGDSAGVPDAVIDGETGLLVDPDSPDAIAHGLIRLLSDEELRTRLGSRARERAERDFNWDRIAEQVDEVLRKALDRR